MLSAIILSAGESRRMGGYPKALLRDEKSGITFIESILKKIISLNISDIVVVLGAHSQEIINGAKPPLLHAGAKTIINENWREGQISSLRKGLTALDPRSEGFMLNPVDCPYVKIKTYRLLMDMWQKNKTGIYIPSYDGKGGHPSIFPGWSYEILLKNNLPQGAKTFIAQNINKISYMSVDDPSVTDDIDTKNDYRKKVKNNE